VALGYTSLWGGDPQDLSAEEVIGAWRQLLPGFDATQHLTGPIVASVGDDGASCATTVRDYHTVIEDGRTSVWMVAGRYRTSLVRSSDGWRIDGITLTVSHESGGSGAGRGDAEAGGCRRRGTDAF
jgi:hypothetical protein